MFDALGEIIVRCCEKADFFPLDRPETRPWSASERHGSWEWTLHKKSRELSRFVSVALTGLHEIGGRHLRVYMVEVSAGADNNDRFTRRVITEFQTNDADIDKNVIGDFLTASVGEAMKVADELTPDDLVEAYPTPRSRRGTSA